MCCVKVNIQVFLSNTDTTTTNQKRYEPMSWGRQGEDAHGEANLGYRFLSGSKVLVSLWYEHQTKLHQISKKIGVKGPGQLHWNSNTCVTMVTFCIRTTSSSHDISSHVPPGSRKPQSNLLKVKACLTLESSGWVPVSWGRFPEPNAPFLDPSLLPG